MSVEHHHHPHNDIPRKNSFDVGPTPEPTKRHISLPDFPADSDTSTLIEKDDKRSDKVGLLQGAKNSMTIRMEKMKNEYNPRVLFAKFKKSLAGITGTQKTMRRLLRYIANEKKLTLCAYTALILTSLAQTKMPVQISHMIDAVVTDRDWERAKFESIIFLITATVYSVSEFFWGHLFYLLSSKIKYNLKVEMYSSMLKREVEFYDRKKLNQLLHHMNGDIGIAQSLCTGKFSSLGRNLIQLVSSAWMLTTVSYKLIVFLIIIVPIHFLIFKGCSIVSEKVRATLKSSTRNTENRVLETFQNIRIVKAFSSEDYEMDAYDNLLSTNMLHNKKNSLVGSTNAAISTFMTNLTLLCIVYIGMNLVSTGEVSPGALSGFLLYSMAVTMGFKDFTNNYLSIKESLPICQQVFQLIDEPGKIPHKGGKTLPDFQGKIELKNVIFHYPVSPHIRVLNDVSLTINPGESAAFVGMSGGGKSTIISILLRFYDVESGDVTLDGTRIQELDLYWLHHQIGYVSQDPILFTGTIEENITYGLNTYTPEKVLEAIKMANAEFIFNKDLFPDGLGTQVGEKGSRLSGGQKQRIAIARALVRDPKILILDEATSNLDANSEFEVQKAIDALITGAKITTVTIAHRLATIVNCKTIYVVRDGEIIEQGSHRELVAQNSAYRALVERQLSMKH